MNQARKLSTGIGYLPGPQEQREQQAVYQPDRKARKIKLLVVVAACFLLALVVIAQYSSLVVMNYRLSGHRAVLLELSEASRELETEVARLSSIGRIEEIARVELGMVEPEFDQLVIIPAGGE